MQTKEQIKISVHHEIKAHELRDGFVFQIKGKHTKHTVVGDPIWIADNDVSDMIIKTSDKKKLLIPAYSVVYHHYEKEIKEGENISDYLINQLPEKKEQKILELARVENLSDKAIVGIINAVGNKSKSKKKYCAIVDCYTVSSKKEDEDYFDVTVKNSTHQEGGISKRFIKIDSTFTSFEAKISICFFDMFLHSRKSNLQLLKSNIFDWINDVQLLLRDGFKTEENIRTEKNIKDVYIYCRDLEQCKDRPSGHKGRFWEGTRRVYSSMGAIREHFDSINSFAKGLPYKRKASVDKKSAEEAFESDKSTVILQNVELTFRPIDYTQSEINFEKEKKKELFNEETGEIY